MTNPSIPFLNLYYSIKRDSSCVSTCLFNFSETVRYTNIKLGTIDHHFNPFITSVTAWLRFSGLTGSAPDSTMLICFLKRYINIALKKAV